MAIIVAIITFFVTFFLVVGIKSYFDHKTIALAFKQEVKVDEVPLTRVFAGVVMRSPTESRIFIHPARTDYEFTMIAERTLGREWFLTASSYFDLTVPRTMNLEAYVKGLEYTRDNYASLPEEKQLIENIIKNVDKTYGAAYKR